MLIRKDNAGVIAIGQASHAWISGQLARAWGNDEFGTPEPREEVCLAAEQHDVGMARWDLAPTRNPDTGLPHSFLEMPLGVHLDLWSQAPVRLESQSRYAALLVSMHGRRLYERRDLEQLPEAEADAVREFIESRRRFEQRLLATLRADPATAASATAELISRNSQLIWIWDYISLVLCLDWAPATAKRVPTARASVDLELAPAGGPGLRTIHPWPFAEARLIVRCEGRRLDGPADTDAELEGALARARWDTVAFELRPMLT